MACFVYKIMFPSGKHYVGISHSPQKRVQEHLTSDALIGKAMRKHAHWDMEVVFSGTRSQCLSLENDLTHDLDTVVPNGYNLQHGGAGGPILSDATREKRRKKKWVRTDEYRRKQSEKMKEVWAKRKAAKAAEMSK